MGSFPFTELLRDLAKRFPPDARWAVTCGSAIALHGLEYQPTDLDFFLPYEDVSRIGGVYAHLEVVFPLEWRTSPQFHSYFGRFQAGGVEVDFVGDFSVSRESVWHRWGSAHPCWAKLRQVEVDGVVVPVYRLEDLLFLYLALPNEDAKLRLLSRALRERGADWDYLRDLFRLWPSLEEPVRNWLAPRP